MSGASDTPMMRQYLELKARVPDALLLYRMGDFYELFFDDAKEAAQILELTLTSRNKSDPNPIPMAGLPHHALDPYMKRLVDAGRKVAIAEQAPPPPGSRSTIMQRKLVRVVTPGLPWDTDGIEAREACWLAGVSGSGPVGLAFLDASTGEFRLTEVEGASDAAAELARMAPREVIYNPETSAGVLRPDIPASAPDPAYFDPSSANTTLCDLLQTVDLLGFGVNGMEDAIGAAGALISYARETAMLTLPHVRRIRTYRVDSGVVLDEATRRNLELVRPMRGSGRRGTLLALMDRCRTPMGGRLLREWLTRPLTDLEQISQRQEAVAALLDPVLRQEVREALARVADMERLASKVAQRTANARDLVALAESLAALPAMNEALSRAAALAGWLPPDLVPDAAVDIHRWLVDAPPAALTDGGMIQRGVHDDLDELVRISQDGKGAIAQMESSLREETGIHKGLRVRHNKVFGYFIEVTQANLHAVPDVWHRKQTLANCERYITPALKEFESRVLGAEERRRELEYELFAALRERIAGHVSRVQAVATAVARVDVVASFAELAVDKRYVRPAVHAGLELDITAGRHPVVETTDLDDRFVPNDISMSADRQLIILTGPNMAGKSTVMRQVALITLMAQCGSFVPAEKATIGLCDRIFVRVGASDDLARGQSTFMVEMSETAAILNQATDRSLILLDEIGRGTSTYDGLSIAWAVAEAVHDRLRARTIFATHYHELVSLADTHTRVANLHVAVSEWGERIIFLRTLRDGGASKSYGIQCARLAGMPPHVVERARALLTELERRPRYGPPTQQLSLFGQSPAEDPPPADDHPVVDAVRALDPDTLSPRAALEALYRLTELLEPRSTNEGP